MNQLSLRLITGIMLAAGIPGTATSQTANRLRTVKILSLSGSGANQALTVIDSTICNYADAASVKPSENLHYQRYAPTQPLSALMSTRYTYTAQGDTLSIMAMNLDVPTGARPQNVFDYGYDAAGNRISAAARLDFQNNGILVNTFRESYQVNAAGLRTKSLREIWTSAGAWLPETQIDMTYNVQGRLMSGATSKWQAATSTWSVTDSVDITYAANDTTEMVRRIYTITTPNWRTQPGAEVRTLAVDAAGRVLQAERHEYLSSSQSYELSTRWKYSYTPGGNPDSITYLVLNPAGNILRGTIDAYEYNGPQGELSRHGSYSVSGLGSHVLRRQYEYEYERIAGVGMTAALTAGSLDVYPVPATHELNVSLGKDFNGRLALYIVDMQGRLIRSIMTSVNAGSRSITLDIGSIPQGNYMLQFNDATGRRFSSKFTVQR